MLTLTEIERAVDALTLEEKAELRRYLEVAVRECSATNGPRRAPYSALEIAPVELGPLLRPLDKDDDLLEEMLETRS